MGGFRPLRTTPGAPREDAVARVRAWAEEAFGVDPEIGWVMVSEVRCEEPGCPPVETVIAVMDGGSAPRRHAVHAPVAEVTAADVRRLAEGP
jgi:hypothetical protein